MHLEEKGTLSLLSVYSKCLCQVPDPQDQDLGKMVSPTVEEGPLWDHLRNINMHRSVGSDEVYLRIPRAVAKPHFSHFLKSLPKRTLITTDQLISFLCLLKSWNTTSWKLCRNTWKTRRWLERGKIALDQPISLLWWNDYISGQGKCCCCYFAWTSVKPLIPSSITSLSLISEVWAWQMDY